MFYCTIRWGGFFAPRFGADMQRPVGEGTLTPSLEKNLQVYSIPWEVHLQGFPDQSLSQMNLTLRNECLCISWLFSDIKITSCSVAQPQCPTKVSLVKVVFGGGHGIQTSWKKKVLSLDQFWIISHHVLHWTDVFTHPSLGFLCGVLFTNWHTHSVQSDV